MALMRRRVTRYLLRGNAKKYVAVAVVCLIYFWFFLVTLTRIAEQDKWHR
jgi:hypothetical protein